MTVPYKIIGEYLGRLYITTASVNSWKKKYKCIKLSQLHVLERNYVPSLYPLLVICENIATFIPIWHEVSMALQHFRQQRPSQYRPGAGRVYLYEKGKKVWPPQVEDGHPLNANHRYWQLNSCTFGHGTLFKGFKKPFYLYETGHWKKLYPNVRWWHGVINPPMPVTLGCTFAGTATFFKGPKVLLSIRNQSHMCFSFSWS